VFVEPDTLPAALKAFVDANPISHLVTASRDLMDGNPGAQEIAVSLGTAAVLTAVFAPLTARLYRTKV
jgi:ABC-2 type transport system permease protein